MHIIEVSAGEAKLWKSYSQNLYACLSPSGFTERDRKGENRIQCKTQELSHLYKSFKSIFPTAHIVIIDHTGSVIMACENRCLIPQTEQYSGFKEILTVHAPTGGTFYKLSFPLPLSNQLFLYIPSKDIEDVLTAAKMADSVIQLFLSRPSQSVQSVRQSDTMLLLDHLFHPSTAEEDTYTALLAAELGFDMSLPGLCAYSA
mgnify:CR=1 FL=1